MMGSRESRNPAEGDTAVRRRSILTEVRAGGTVDALRAVRTAASGDPVAGSIDVGALLQALGLGTLDSHDLLVRVHLAEARHLGDLDPEEREALCRLVARMSRIRRSRVQALG